LVDVEVEHDAHGLPYVHGRNVKGLLKAAADELFATSVVDHNTILRDARVTLLGETGDIETSKTPTTGCLHIGHAQIADEDLIDALKSGGVTRKEVLDAFTTIRRQTSINGATGAAAENTLRSVRVLSRGLILRAFIRSERDLSDAEKALLAALAASIRRMGTRRNRGQGRVKTELLDASGKTLDWLDLFERELKDDRNSVLD
jgi:hypothetical protein